jgi:hypothetical protein
MRTTTGAFGTRTSQPAKPTAHSALKETQGEIAMRARFSIEGNKPRSLHAGGSLHIAVSKVVGENRAIAEMGFGFQRQACFFRDPETRF